MDNAKERLEQIREEIEALEGERRAIYRASLNAPEEEKVCEDFFAEMLAEKSPFASFTWPQEIHGLSYGGPKVEWMKRRPQPQLVRVRLASDDTPKTYLGVVVADIPLQVTASLHRETGILDVSPGMYNPAIVVPELNRIVMGCESWWSAIASAEELQEITDSVIENSLPVQVLKTLFAPPEEETETVP